MENRVKDDILTGTITNKETGEAHDIDPSYWFPNGCELNAIAKILRVVGSQYYFNGSPSRMIKVDCLALDCQGNVFKLNLCFMPECLEEEQKIGLEITEG